MSRYDHIQEVGKSRYDVIQEIEKFNPYHGRDGRFSSANSAASFTYKPGQGKMYDNAIARERARTAAAEAAAGGTPKKGLAEGLGAEHAKAIEKLVHENMPKQVQAMWDKHGDGIRVADSKHSKVAYSGSDGIHLDIESDAAGIKTKSGASAKSPYQISIHESAHAIDDIVSKKVGYEFAVEHNGRKFEKTLIQESNNYIKSYQKQMQGQLGRKVSIDEARKGLAMELFKENDYLSTGMLSDILGGATNGKFVGTSGHAKQYWTGWKDYFGNTRGAHSVATEAWAHFTSTAANEKSAARLQSVFPESYKEYLSMCEFAASV